MTDKRSDMPHQRTPDHKPTDLPDREPSDYNDPVDEASDESFPASDPPSSSGATATREPDDAKRDR